MSLFRDGMKGIFGYAFAPLYEDATLHIKTLMFAENGDRTETESDHAVKAARAHGDDRLLPGGEIQKADISVIVLIRGVTVTPTAEDDFTFLGRRYSIMSATEASGGTHWLLRGLDRKEA